MNSQKHLFNLKPGVHYLNCAYKAPLLRSAEEVAVQALIRQRNPADISSEDFFKEVVQVRTLFGKIINGYSGRIALIPSASYGFSSALLNVKPKKKGNAITIKDEFPSGYFSLQRWCEKNDNELKVIEPNPGLQLAGENWNRKIIEAIDIRTTVVLISSVHWMNGLRFDLKAIGEKCSSVGARFIVDGTQSVGALPMDVEEFKIDALICATYKWLLGPYSLGLVFMGKAFDDGVPLEESWMNRKNSMDFSTLTHYESEYEESAARYNVGETSNFILMPMLRESLAQINSWGVPAIQQYSQTLIQPYLKYVNGLGVELEKKDYFSNHLFSLKVPEEMDGEKLKQNLKDNNVIVSVRGEFIRVSVYVFNEESDIDKLIQCIEMTRSNL